MGVAAIAGYTLLELLVWGVLDQLREKIVRPAFIPPLFRIWNSSSQSESCILDFKSFSRLTVTSCLPVETYATLGNVSRTLLMQTYFIGSGDVPRVLSQAAKQTKADLLVTECYPYSGNLRILGYAIICAVPIPVS